MSKRARILFVSPETPRPTGTGGRVRSWHLLRALSKDYQVTLLLLNRDELEMDPELARNCVRLIRPAAGARKPPVSTWRSRLKSAGVLAFPWQQQWATLAAYAGQYCQGRGTNGGPRSTRILSALLGWEFRAAARFFAVPPMLTLYLRNGAANVSPQVKSLLAAENYEILWYEHSFCHPVAVDLLPANQHPLVVCSTQNVESKLQSRCAAIARTTAEERWLSLQSQLLQKVEVKAFQDCQLAVACSESDESLIANLAPGANTLVLANGVDTSYFRPPTGSVRNPLPTILFTAGFAYQANHDAIDWFIRDIFPLVRQAVPQARFVFAGLAAQAAFDRMQDRPEGVGCVSDPADIRPQFQDAWVFVVPLRAGGGTRLKILEAMAMELPVVSTRIGAEGVPYQDGEHLLLADSPSDFARAVVRLLQSAELRCRIAGTGARFAREHYDWTALTATIGSKLNSMLSGDKGAVAA